MDKYWVPVDIEGTDIVVEKDHLFYYGGQYLSNPYVNKTDNEIRLFKFRLR